MIFHENRLLADDSHEISCLIHYFGKRSRILNCHLLQVIGGALRVNSIRHHQTYKVVSLLTLCIMGNCLCFLSSAVFFFKKQLFRKNYFRKTIRVSNSLDPDQVRHFVGPGLDPNCLQKLSADDTRR